MTSIKQSNEVSICLDNVGYNQKPDKRTTAKIVEGIASLSTQISIEEFAQSVVLPGAKSFTPALFNETFNKYNVFGYWKNKEGWKEQQLLVLDIDKNLSFNEALIHCIRYNILPVFCYSSFSDTGSKDTGYYKFRMLFMLPEKIDNIQIRNLGQYSLAAIFPERDTSCDEESKLFYGGKELIYENYESRIDIHSVIHAAGIYLKEKDASNYAKNYARYCNQVGLCSIKNTPDITVEEIDLNDFLIQSTNNFAPHIEDCTKTSNMTLLQNYRQQEYPM